MNRMGLICSFDLDPTFNHDKSWTRQDLKAKKLGRDHGTLIDYILITKNLVELVKDIRICIKGDNLSDHHPVEIDLELSLQTFDFKKLHSFPEVINWKSVIGETTCEK